MYGDVDVSMTDQYGKTTRDAYVSPIEPVEMNEDGCFELVVSHDPQDCNRLPMTPTTGTPASPERAAAAVQVFQPWRSVLGDSHIAFAQLERPSDFSNKLTFFFNLRKELAGAIRHRRCSAAKPASSSAPAAAGP